jgi:predicted MFS family arabinose efflux permease
MVQPLNDRPYDGSVTTPVRTQPSPIIATRSRTFAAFDVPQFGRLWSIGLLWNLTRWMCVFLCSYFVSEETDSPFLVQIVGASFFAPMFLTGALGGVISDRLDRRRTMLYLTMILVPASATMAAVTFSGGLRVWMVYLFILAVGLTMVVDMTSRRALVYDIVGAERVTNALALEALAMTGGTLVGNAGAGTIISAVGIGSAFAVAAVCYGFSAILIAGLPSTAARRSVSATKPHVVADIKAAVAYVRAHRALISILGVTIVMNSFYFSFTPMVPLFADDMGVNALWAGVLASAPAFGSMFGTLLIARGSGITRGQAYVCGSALALTFLGVFAASGWYPVALIALIVAGFGTSGFATMQSALVMLNSDDEMRGRALGILSMSIGALPFSMLLLGGTAQAIGPQLGVVVSTVLGVAVLALWSRSHPEAYRQA